MIKIQLYCAAQVHKIFKMAVNKFQFKRLSLLHGLFLSYNRISFTDLLTQLNNQLDTDKRIARRTLFLDIAQLKELGAPIMKEGKLYTYAEGFSLFEVFNPTEVELMRETVGLLRRIAAFEYIKDFLPEIESLMLKLNSQELQQRKVIYFEQNSQYQGIEYLHTLYHHISTENVLEVTYVDFQSNVFQHIFHPYLLKEYNRRWYVFGLEQESKEIYRFPLDRIRKVETSTKRIDYQPNEEWDAEQHFKEMVGISREIGQQPETIRLRAFDTTVDYLLTKPLHVSQRLTNESETHSDFEYVVIRNYEFEALVRSFGNAVKEV